MRDSEIIFVFGLPRSGTTVLQRLLSSNNAVITQDETWLLQRMLSNDDNRFASPSNYLTAIAASSRAFESLDDEIFRFCCDLIKRQAARFEGVEAVIEKTPRNYLYLNFFFRNSVKYVGIVRSPSAIINSMFNEFLGGTFRGLVDYEIDLACGPNLMVQDAKQGSSLIVKYEDLNQRKTLDLIENYTGLTLDPNALPRLAASIGDTNQNKSLVVVENVDFTGINTVVKKLYTKRAIRLHFELYCQEFGYPLAEELKKLEYARVSWCLHRNIVDLFWLTVFAVQKTSYQIYRRTRRTTNLSSSLSCS